MTLLTCNMLDEMWMALWNPFWVVMYPRQGSQEVMTKRDKEYRKADIFMIFRTSIRCRSTPIKV